MSVGQQLSEASASDLARNFSELVWPIGDEAIPAIIIGWGWQVSSARPGVAYRAETSYDFTRPMASFIVVNLVLAEISLNTTDAVEEEATESKGFLRDAFARQVGAVSAIVGKPRKRSAGAKPSAVWMLENGSRLTTQAYEFGCFWDVTSPEFVKIQSSL